MSLAVEIMFIGALSVETRFSTKVLCDSEATL